MESQTIGPFSQDVVLDTIVISNKNGIQKHTLSVSGSVLDCSNNPVTNGYVKIKGDDTYLVPVVNGQYGVSFVTCQKPSDFTITAFDLGGNVSSVTQSGSFLSSNFVNMDLKACGQELPILLTLHIDSSEYRVVSELDTALASRSWFWDTTNNSSFNDTTTNIVATSSLINVNFSMPLVRSTGQTTQLVLGVSSPDFKGWTTFPRPNQQVTITKLADYPGDYLDGSFLATVKDAANIDHVISGTFHVRTSY